MSFCRRRYHSQLNFTALLILSRFPQYWQDNTIEKISFRSCCLVENEIKVTELSRRKGKKQRNSTMTNNDEIANPGS